MVDVIHGVLSVGKALYLCLNYYVPYRRHKEKDVLRHQDMISPKLSENPRYSALAIVGLHPLIRIMLDDCNAPFNCCDHACLAASQEQLSEIVTDMRMQIMCHC